MDINSYEQIGMLWGGRNKSNWRIKRNLKINTHLFTRVKKFIEIKKYSHSVFTLKFINFRYILLHGVFLSDNHKEFSVSLTVESSDS